ncbi:2-oxo acid dehydrogenase subunit E2 [Chloroflexales bacterium ZM16-3]|nr:2-oxo acid dehydrogenase subunit E2 [Chloroflexales bacterium ZM16-3]
MTTDIKMPQLGESVTEGTVGRWLKQPGEMVQKYEPLLEVVTDKVDTEVPSPVSGTLIEVIIAEGETVRVGTVLARVGAADGAVVPVGASRETPLPTPLPTPPEAPANGRNAFLSPVVARLVAEHGLDPAQIAGSGQGGRVTKQDVLRAVAQESGVGSRESGIREQSPEINRRPQTLTTALTPTPDSRLPTPDSELVPLSPMRRVIAEHMERSVRTAPHVTAVIEVDLSRIVAHRAASRAAFEAQGVRLTFTPYFIQATLAGLQSAPVLNGSFSPQGITVHRRMHIGMAVALDEGLIVPVLRDADEKNLLGLARAVGDLAERARSRRLLPDETQGGTFTLTNHGTTGSLFATPIINQPQSGILGVGAIVKRPVVISQGGVDAIAIKPMCYLSLTFDHRVADGAVGDAFLTGAKGFLESFL